MVEPNSGVRDNDLLKIHASYRKLLFGGSRRREEESGRVGSSGLIVMNERMKTKLGTKYICKVTTYSKSLVHTTGTYSVKR